MFTKKSVFCLSFVYILYAVVLIAISTNCTTSRSWCNFREDDPLGMGLFIFMSLLPVFFLSLLTYKMKEEVFQAWWRFSRWFVPIIVMVTFFLSVAPGQSGFAAVAAQSFNFLILAILYITFILISLIKIVRAYRRTK